MAENIEIYQNQIALARTEIKNLRQKLSALKHEHRKEMKYIKDILEGLKCSSCGSEATEISNQNHVNETPVTSEVDCIVFRPIGYIHTMFENKRAVPRQPTLLTKGSGTVVIDSNIFSNPAHALEGLEEFSHMWLLYHFHKTEGAKTPAKVTPPRLGERRGVFSTRSPHRPCPIGMSLVKIQSIEGNKIHFLGIDMIDGTPLLDIKPYIPQYDYPASFDSSMLSRIRPPTEGISDILEPITNLQLDEEDYGTSSHDLNQIAVDTSSPGNLPRSPYDEGILSPDNQDTQLSSLIQASSQSSESPSSVDLVDGIHPSPTRRLHSERGAPDGQERFTPPQSNLLNANYDGIRVASWIANPPSQRYHVTFNDEAFARLHELIGARAEPFKTNIECLLSEDPRSVYVRTRYPDHEYSCVLEDLSISCLFDAAAGVCTIVAVRSAEELQDN